MEERERESVRERIVGGDRDLDAPWVRVSSKRTRQAKTSFCLFAANLTFDTTEADLIRIFGYYGKIRDVYIPWNRVLNRSRGYAFIRFYYEQDALNAIHCLHERRIDGRIAHVDWAKGQAEIRAEYENRPLPLPQQLKPAPDRSFLNAVSNPRKENKLSQEHLGVATVADPRAVETKLSRLKLAMVGTVATQDVNIVRLSEALKNAKMNYSEVEIVRISDSKFLLTFQSAAEVEDFSSNTILHCEMGLQLVERWAPDHVIGGGGVWVRLFGIPAHAWIESVIIDLASYFGKITQFDPTSRFGYFQAFARIRIIPRPGVSFKDVLRLQVLGKEYPIIAELEPLFSIAQAPSQQQAAKEGTREWVLRRFHGTAGNSKDVCENAPIREESFFQDKRGVLTIPCTKVNVADWERNTPNVPTDGERDTYYVPADPPSEGRELYFESAGQVLMEGRQLSNVGNILGDGVIVPSGGREHSESRELSNVIAETIPREGLITQAGVRQNAVSRECLSMNGFPNAGDPSTTVRVQAIRNSTPDIECNARADGIEKRVAGTQHSLVAVVAAATECNASAYGIDKREVRAQHSQEVAVAGARSPFNQLGDHQGISERPQVRQSEKVSPNQGEVDMVCGLQPYIQPLQNMVNSLSQWNMLQTEGFLDGGANSGFPQSTDENLNRPPASQLQMREVLLSSGNENVPTTSRPEETSTRMIETDSSVHSNERSSLQICRMLTRKGSHSFPITKADQSKILTERAVLEVDLSPYFPFMTNPVNAFVGEQVDGYESPEAIQSERQEMELESELGSAFIWENRQQVSTTNEAQQDKSPQTVENSRHFSRKQRNCYTKENWSSRLRRLKRRAVNSGCVTDG